MNYKSNVFTKHHSIEHYGHQRHPDAFTMKDEKTYQIPLDRQVMQAIDIASLEPEKTPTSRAEYIHTTVVRIIPRKELPEIDGTVNRNMKTGRS